MGWFESQIEERRRADQDRLSSAMQKLVSAVDGRAVVYGDDALRQAGSALEAILGFYGFKTHEAPRSVKTVQALMDYHTRPAGVMYREVTLPHHWYKDAIGPMLGFTTDNVPVALIPASGGYRYKDPATNATVHLNGQTESHLLKRAFCFYRPLPSSRLKLSDLTGFLIRCLSRRDYLVLLAATLAVTLLGLVLPIVNQIIFGPVVEATDTFILVPVLVLLIGVQFAQILITATRTVVMSGIGAKLSITVEAAVMMRTLRLPASFFKDYGSGDLALRIQSLTEAITALTATVIQAVLTAVFSLIYLAQILFFAPPLALPALIIVAVMAAIMALTGHLQVQVMRETLAEATKLSGWQYALIGGVAKVKLAGAERRGLATWAERYAPLARLTYNGPLLVRIANPFVLAVSLIGTILIYYIAYQSGVAVDDYMAFTAAFGMVTGAFTELSTAVMSSGAIRAQLELAEPMLQELPEANERRAVIERIGGSVEVENVTFAYDRGQKPVIDGLSLKIRRGQYVAIVGKSGCGKSTLVRLLLGFERPTRGAVYYDGRDVNTVDVGSLRQHIGVVLQDGKLFQGDLFSNITISAPEATLDDAWAAAELAGIADDIRAMPMGMFTMVSEGGGGVSGGQRQRLMIARALAQKPKLLIFDEATSALDNITQRIVADSLDGLKCTRIVVAHRLSTIRTCDRIVVLDGGGIVEDGAYEELIARRGPFYELVRRQQLEED